MAEKKEAVIKEHDVMELVCSSISRVTTVPNIAQRSEEKNFLVNVQMNRIFLLNSS